MLAETPVTQRSPCYSAVSSSLTNPLPVICHLATPTTSLRIITSLVFSGQTFYQPLRWRLILHCCSALLQNLVGKSGETRCLEEDEQHAEASVDVPYPLLQIVNLVPFLSISILSLLPFSILSLLSLLIKILCPHKTKTSISLHFVSLMAHIFASCFTP